MTFCHIKILINLNLIKCILGFFNYNNYIEYYEKNNVWI